MVLRQEGDGLPQVLIGITERRQFLAVLLPLGNTFPTPISFPLPILFRQIFLPDGLLRMMTCVENLFLPAGDSAQVEMRPERFELPAV